MLRESGLAWSTLQRRNFMDAHGNTKECEGKAIT